MVIATGLRGKKVLDLAAGLLLQLGTDVGSVLLVVGGGIESPVIQLAVMSFHTHMYTRIQWEDQALSKKKSVCQ